MALDEQELQEQLFEDIGVIKDTLNIHTQVLQKIFEEITKPASDGDKLFEVLRDIHAAIERNNGLLARVEARLSQAG